MCLHGSPDRKQINDIYGHLLWREFIVTVTLMMPQQVVKDAVFTEIKVS